MKISSIFLTSCVLIIGVSALGKVLGLIEGRTAVQGFDEIVPISRWSLLLSVAILESLVVTFLLFRFASSLSYFVIAWLSSVFLAYRVVKVAFGIPFSCQCLGLFTKYLPLNAWAAGAIMTIAAIYMFTGSVLTLSLKKDWIRK